VCSRAAEAAPPALAEGRSQSDLADESAAARLVSARRRAAGGHPHNRGGAEWAWQGALSVEA
jgi:hypothetical protein